MRNLNYLAIAILLFGALSTVSCKKDNRQDPLVGKWNEVSEKVSTYLNDTLYNEQTINSEPGQIMQILADGTGKFYTNYVYDDSFKWKVEEDMFVFNYSSGDTSKMKYTLGKTSLTLQLTELEGTGNLVFKYIVVQNFNRN